MSDFSLASDVDDGVILGVLEQHIGVSGNKSSSVRVLFRKQNFKDLDRWQVAKISHELEQRFRSQFHRKFPLIKNCESPEKNISKPWKYKDSDIKIEKTYAFANQWIISQLRLEKYRCDGPISEVFDRQWFAISPSGDVIFLDNGMMFIDAGDYDGDGRSEILFQIDQYNLGGM